MYGAKQTRNQGLASKRNGDNPVGTPCRGNQFFHSLPLNMDGSTGDRAQIQGKQGGEAVQRSVYPKQVHSFGRELSALCL